MSRRDREDDLTDLIPSVTAADAYLTDLSRGERPGDGEEDRLADLFLELREEVEQPMPAAPRLPEGDGGRDTVVPLRRRGGLGRSLVSGMVGAAAATLVVVGGGAAIYNAEPGSPLWGMSKQLFGERAAVVEMAGTLEDLDSFAQNGDVEAIRTLLNDARARLGEERTGGTDREVQRAPAPGTTTTTATVEREPEGDDGAPAAPTPSPEGTAPAVPPAERETVRETATATATATATTTVTEQETVTETAVRTATETVTVVPQAPIEPAPTAAPEPTAAPGPSTPPQATGAPTPEQ